VPARHRLTFFSFLGVCVCAAFWIQGAVSAAGPQDQPQVTFNKDIAPILYANCASCHHPGESAPFSLLNYQDAKQHAKLIATATANHYMPPWQPDSEGGEFEGDRRLSKSDIETIQEWSEGGSLEGDPRDLPPLPDFGRRWTLGTPDLIVEMPDAITVPADGPDVFRNFLLPIPLADRKFVRAIEFRPGNPRVVHHVRIMLDDTGEVRALDRKDPEPGFGGMDVPGARFPDGHFLGWAPGKMPETEAFPWPLEPGTDFVLQMHLKPGGKAEQVRASIGLYFTDKPAATTPLMIRLGSKVIDIPAGAARHEVIDTYTLPVDVTVTSVYPHAHYLAKDMRVTAKKRDGSVETLLHIPNWNFNWQDAYAFRRPQQYKKGTTITMRYTYDNSDANPRNPSQPPRRVRFGSETTDEMGELLVQVLTKSADDQQRLRVDVARKNLLTDVAGEEKRLIDRPNDVETRNALGVGYVQLGRQADAIRQFEEVLRERPDHAMGHYNLAVMAMADRRFDEAIDHLNRALISRPDYSEAHNNLGVLLEAMGRGDEARAQFAEALEARPSSPAAHNNLGRNLLARGDVDGAMSHFRAALRTRPDHPDTLYNVGRAYATAGSPKEAVQQWKHVIAVRPDMVAALIDLARLLSTNDAVRNPSEAIVYAEQANRVSGGNNAAALDTLAAAYAASERFDLAVRAAQRALQRALADNNDPLATSIRQRLNSYQNLTAAGGAENP
jgi:tetratricopeptide (TPR) repeat protein